MCVLHVSFGSNIRPITFGCVAMGSAVLFILSSRLLLYYAGSVLSGFSVRWVFFSRQKLYVGMVVCISWLYSCLCV